MRRARRSDVLRMGLALALSWGSMLAHNLYELPIGVLALENTGPLALAVALFGGYAVAPRSVIVLGLVVAWGVLNLAVGGILTVLPLPILPFSPEQSVSHYLAHVVYSVGQVPLLVVASRAAAASRAAG